MGFDVIVIRGHSIRFPDHYQESFFPEIITIVIPIIPNISGLRIITEFASDGKVSRKRFGRSLINKLLRQRRLWCNWRTPGVDLCELINKCDLNSNKIKEVVINVFSSYFHPLGRTYNVQDSYIVENIHIPSTLLPYK